MLHSSPTIRCKLKLAGYNSMIHHALVLVSRGASEDETLQVLLPAVFFLDFDVVEAWIFYFKRSSPDVEYSELTADEKFQDLCKRIVCCYVSSRSGSPPLPVGTWLKMGKNASAVNDLLRTRGGTSNADVLNIWNELRPAQPMSLTSRHLNKNPQGKHEHPVFSQLSLWRLATVCG